MTFLQRTATPAVMRPGEGCYRAQFRDNAKTSTSAKPDQRAIFRISRNWYAVARRARTEIGSPRDLPDMQDDADAMASLHHSDQQFLDVLLELSWPPHLASWERLLL